MTPHESLKSQEAQRPAADIPADTGKEAVLSVARDADRLNGGKVPGGQQDMVRGMMEKVSALPPELQKEFAETVKVQSVGAGIERGQALSRRNAAVEDSLSGEAGDPTKLIQP